MEEQDNPKYLLKKIHIFDYLIFALCIFHLVANLIWIKLDVAPPPWDQAGHTMISLKFIDYFVGFNNNDFLRISDYYPPFVHLAVAFFMMLFGSSIIVGQLVITFFFLAAIVFLYLYTYELFRNRPVAFFATLFFSFFPAIYGLSRYYLLDISLVTLILGCLLFLEKSHNFTKSKYTILFFVTFSLSIFTKWYSFIYIMVPLTLSLVAIFKNRLFTSLEILKYLFLGIIIILVINLPWYLRNIDVLLASGSVNITPELADPQNIFSIQNWIFYLQLLVNFQLTFWGMLVFLISLPFFIFSKKKKALIIFVSMIFIYLSFSLIGNKNIRYTLMLVPLASIIIGFFTASLFKFSNILGKVFSSIFILYLVGYFFILSFGFPIDPLESNFRRTFFLPALGGIDYINIHRETSKYLAPKFDNATWPDQRIINDLSENKSNSYNKILVLVEKPNLNPENLKLFSKLLNINNLEFDAPYNMEPFKDDDDLEKYLSKHNFIMVAQNDFGPQGGIRHLKVLQQLKSFLSKVDKIRITKNVSSNNILSYYQISLIKSYPLPDGDNLLIYEIKFTKV